MDAGIHSAFNSVRFHCAAKFGNRWASGTELDISDTFHAYECLCKLFLHLKHDAPEISARRADFVHSCLRPEHAQRVLDQIVADFLTWAVDDAAYKPRRRPGHVGVLGARRAGARAKMP